MRKFILANLLLLLLALPTWAQTTDYGFSSGVLLGSQAMDFRNSPFGYGAFVSGHYNLIEDKLDLVLTLTYMNFMVKSQLKEAKLAPSVTILPITIGGRYFFDEDAKFFAGLDLGVSLFSRSAYNMEVNLNNVGATSVPIEEVNKTIFNISPSIGYSFPLGDDEKRIEIIARIDYMPSIVIKEREYDVFGTYLETDVKYNSLVPSLRLAYKLGY